MPPVDSTRHFDQDKAKAYDRLIRQVVPGYETLHDLIGVLLAHEVRAEAAALLSVGCGTGQEIVALGCKFPSWSMTGIEPSATMAQAAMDTIAQHSLSERCTVVSGYLDDLDPGLTFDAATLVLVLHFLADDGSKRALLDAIFKRLKPNTPLVMADLNAAPDTARYEKLLAVWRDWQLFQGLPEHIVDRGFEQVVRDIQFVSEDRIRDLLHAAGFRGTERFYAALLFDGWITWKPDPPL